MLNMKKELIAKVMAYRLKFNVELPHHLCVMVPKSALMAHDSSATFEVVDSRWGYQKAKGTIQLNTLCRANGMKLRSLVNLKSSSDGKDSADRADTKERFDIDVEIRLLALVPHKVNKREE